jgi:uncharacterized protein
MADIWEAAREGDVGEVGRLVGQDPGLLNATGFDGRTPLMVASGGGHVGVVRWLLDRGAATDERRTSGVTALWFASRDGRTPVVELLLQRGADPAIASSIGVTPLIIASHKGRLETVQCLLGNPTAVATINSRDKDGVTALLWACAGGHGGVVRLLLEKGADPSIASKSGATPVAVARQGPLHDGVSAEGARECLQAAGEGLASYRPFIPYLLAG